MREGNCCVMRKEGRKWEGGIKRGKEGGGSDKGREGGRDGL